MDIIEFILANWETITIIVGTLGGFIAGIKTIITKVKAIKDYMVTITGKDSPGGKEITPEEKDKLLDKFISLFNDLYERYSTILKIISHIGGLFKKEKPEEDKELNKE